MAHAGNILEASRALGLPYPTVRDLYRGRTTNPSLRTLRTIGSTYGVPLSWLTEGVIGEPPAAFIGFLDLESGAVTPGEIPLLRRVRIPLAAWPLYRVGVTLLEYLRSLPPSTERPIAGDARDDREVVKRLTTFLLQPVLAAESVGEPEAVVSLLVADGTRGRSTGSEESWIERLRALGETWELVLPQLLARARERERRERQAQGG